METNPVPGDKHLQSFGFLKGWDFQTPVINISSSADCELRTTSGKR